MDGMNNNSFEFQNQSLEKASSLSQTKAKYHQIIEKLTADRLEDSIGIKSQSSSSLRHHGSPGESTPEITESKDDKQDNTPEEIREYVKQFKVEVEIKYKKSKANKNFKLKRRSSYIDTPSLSLSVKDIFKYDLGSQNIYEKYADSNKENPSILADILTDLGNVDRATLEGILTSNQSKILQLLYDALKNRVPEALALRSRYETQKLRLASQDLEKIISRNPRLESQRNTKHKVNVEELGSNVKKSSSKSKKKKKNASSKQFHAQSRQDSLGHDKNNPKLMSNYKKNKGSILSMNSHKKKKLQVDHEDLTQKKSLLIRHIQNGTAVSPNRKTTNINKAHIQKSAGRGNNQNGIPYYGRERGGNMGALQFSKASNNFTLFTNNTLMSTLSPKSNISLSTLKSNSRSRSRYNRNRQSGQLNRNVRNGQVQFKVGSKILNRIKKEEPSDGLRGNSTSIKLTKYHSKRQFGGNMSNKGSKEDLRIYGVKQNTRSNPRKRPVSSRNNFVSVINKKKKASKKKVVEQNGVMSLSKQNKYLSSLSNVNWRRRLEKLM